MLPRIPDWYDVVLGCIKLGPCRRRLGRGQRGGRALPEPLVLLPVSSYLVRYLVVAVRVAAR